MSIKGSVTTSDYLNFDSTLNKAVRLIKNDKNYKLGFLVVLGINSGLRISDILSLKFSDLDGDSITLLEKKTNKKRIIRINDNIKDAFELLKTRTENHEGHIFTSKIYQ